MAENRAADALCWMTIRTLLAAATRASLANFRKAGLIRLEIRDRRTPDAFWVARGQPSTLHTKACLARSIRSRVQVYYYHPEARFRTRLVHLVVGLCRKLLRV